MKGRKQNISIAALLAGLLFLSWMPPGDSIVSASLYYNPILSPNIAPMYFPVIGGVNPTINLVCPKEISLEDIKIPNITLDGVKVPDVTISQINLKNTVTLGEKFYQQYGKFVGASQEQIKAAHNFAVTKMENAIVTGVIEKGCKVTAKITVEAAEKLIKKKIPINEKLAKVASGIPGTIAKTLAKQTAQQFITDKCIISTKFVGRNVIEITVDTFFGLKNSVEEAKYWMAYMNSVEGMIWISNNLK
jgi:hypothetical protein